MAFACARALIIVSPEPLCGGSLRPFDAGKDMLVQPIISDRAIVPLHIGMWLWISRQDVFEYIELFYNPKRRHANNGMLSPVDYEMAAKMK